jgi:hypothetical protein
LGTATLLLTVEDVPFGCTGMALLAKPLALVPIVTFGIEPPVGPFLLGVELFGLFFTVVVPIGGTTFCPEGLVVLGEAFWFGNVCPLCPTVWLDETVAGCRARFIPPTLLLTLDGLEGLELKLIPLTSTLLVGRGVTVLIGAFGFSILAIHPLGVKFTDFRL